MYDNNQYDVSIIEKSMMGSMGIRVGHIYMDADDYALIRPKYDTDFRVTYHDGYLNPREIVKEGNFTDAFFGELSDELIYGSYISSDRDLIKKDNKLNNNGKKVLLIKDSFEYLCLLG